MIVATSFSLSHDFIERHQSWEFIHFEESRMPSIDERVLHTEALYVRQQFARTPNLSAFPNLKWIQVPSAGYESVDIDELVKRGITLTNGRGVYSIPIAEDVMCKMLMLARHSREASAKQTSGEWGYPSRSVELYGKTLGILGTGSIACEIALRASAFGMKVLGANTDGRPVNGFLRVYSGREGLLELFESSDHIVAALPHNRDTEGLVDRQLIQAMKPSAYFINIGRGHVVNEGELIAALEEGRIAGAGLDVFQMEPLPKSSPLWGMPNVIITPHNSGNGDNVAGRLKDLFSHNLKAFPNRAAMLNVVV